jgi:hypothetical protein
MQIYEISFGELRQVYKQIRELIKENSGGLQDEEIGLYSAIEKDLGFYNDDSYFLEESFVDKFGIGEPTMVEQSNKYSDFVSYFLGFAFLVCIAYLAITNPIPFFMICVIILFLVIWGHYSPKKKITVPAKKQWQKDQLTVADLVSSAVAKRFVQKKEIVFVLKK